MKLAKLTPDKSLPLTVKEFRTRAPISRLTTSRRWYAPVYVTQLDQFRNMLQDMNAWEDLQRRKRKEIEKSPILTVRDARSSAPEHKGKHRSMPRPPRSVEGDGPSAVESLQARLDAASMINGGIADGNPPPGHRTQQLQRSRSYEEHSLSDLSEKSDEKVRVPDFMRRRAVPSVSVTPPMERQRSLHDADDQATLSQSTPQPVLMPSQSTVPSLRGSNSAEELSSIDKVSETMSDPVLVSHVFDKDGETMSASAPMLDLNALPSRSRRRMLQRRGHQSDKPARRIHRAKFRPTSAAHDETEMALTRPDEAKETLRATQILWRYFAGDIRSQIAFSPLFTSMTCTSFATSHPSYARSPLYTHRATKFYRAF